MFHGISLMNLENLFIAQVDFFFKLISNCFYQKNLQHIYMFKVEKNLKGSLVLIPSPSASVKIQIMGRKFCLRQNIAVLSQQTFENKKFV